MQRKRNRKAKRKQKQAGQTAVSAIPRASQRPIFAAFFLSGLAALMHQVVWSKLLVQLIGATAYAQAVVLAVFMGGLALGAFLFGRRSDRRGRPLRSYVALEFSIGGYCLSLPLLLYLAELGYVSLATQLFEFSAVTLLLRFVLVALLILLPAVLMGGTLPILARHLVGRVEDTQRQVGKLYALNSFGAVAGAGIAGFVTLPLLGIYFSLAVASLLNFASAGLVLGRAKREQAPDTEPGSARVDSDSASSRARSGAEDSYLPGQYNIALIALFLSGFAAMGYEVLFIRIIALSFGSSTYSFSVMLMSFIAGIAIGSALVSRLEIRNPLWLFGASQFAVAVALLIATPLIARMPYLIGLLRIELQDAALGFELYQAGKAALCLAVLLLPSICLGASFPLVARIQARHPHEIGTRVGSTYAWNTAGNLLGVVITSLVLLPVLGLRDGFHFNIALNLVAGAAVLLAASEARLARRVLAGGFAGLVGCVYLAVGSDWSESINLSKNHLRLRSGPDPSLNAAARAQYPSSSFEAWKQAYVARAAEVEDLFFDEDAHAAVLVTKSDDDLVLYVNSKPDASTGHDLDVQLLLAHAPLFLAPDARNVLVIGHGSGVTAGAAARHPVEQVDIVEISPAVLQADFMFAGVNHAILDDPRVSAYVDDGQSFLRTVPYRYDVIISQPPNPWVAGVGGLFTVEYFEKVRDRLSPGGIFSFWFHAYEQSDEAVQLMMRTLGSVFPQVMIFGDADLGDLIAIASMEPIQADFEKMGRRYRQAAVGDDLARVKITNLLSLLSHHRLSQSQFRRLKEPGPVNTAGHQRLEYMAARSFFRRDVSTYIDRFDPLVQGVPKQTDLLLDRYIEYRSQTGNPVSRQELLDAVLYARSMGAYGPKVARSIAARIN